MARSLTNEEREELTAYLDGEGDAESRADIAGKIKRDPAWRAEADALKQAWDMLDQLKTPEASSSFTTRTMSRLVAIRADVDSAVPAASQNRWPWEMLTFVVIGLLTGWLAAGLFTRPRGPVPLRPDDPQLVRDLRVIEHLPLYYAVESLDYLHALDQHDRFGADSTGP